MDCELRLAEASQQYGHAQSEAALLRDRMDTATRAHQRDMEEMTAKVLVLIITLITTAPSSLLLFVWVFI